MHTIKLALISALALCPIAAAPVLADAHLSGAESGHIPAAPEEGGPRNWEVTASTPLMAEPDAASSILAVYPPGTILDNFGCEMSSGMVWCDVQQLGGGPVGLVNAEFLQPAISPDGSAAMGPDDSALRAGQGDFDATGQVACAQSFRDSTIWCDFGVARAGGGYATVVMTRPDGGTRTIFFRLGQPIGASTSEADPSGEFGAVRVGDRTLIQMGEERYEIPDAVILGG